MLLACGSKPTPPQQHGDEHHAKLPPELARFHDVLAPRWHADPGPARVKSTCDAIPDFRTRADALAKVTPAPPDNADAWTTGTKQLAEAVEALAATCGANDLVAFDPAFARLHESFEALAESAMHER